MRGPTNTSPAAGARPDSPLDDVALHILAQVTGQGEGRPPSQRSPGGVIGPLMAGAEAVLVSAASLGFFPNALFPSHPRTIPVDRETLRHFEKRDYQVRPAREDDLEALQRLETLCWEPALQTAGAVLRKRVTDHPGGQFALVSEGRVVGVLYSQRIADRQHLRHTCAERVDALHRPDGPVVQLLAINIDPSVLHRQWGDPFLEYVLQRCAVMPGVDAVVAVTKCRDFHRQQALSMEAYVRHCNAHGYLSDPILRFHELHGATFQELLPQYRPKDVKNQGFGVLVAYDIHNRKRREVGSGLSGELGLEGSGERQPDDLEDAIAQVLAREDEPEPGIDDFGYFLEKAIRTLLGPANESRFSREAPLMEMGLDSMDLLGLGEQLALRFPQALEPTFFFRHKTHRDIFVCYKKETGAGSGALERPEDAPERGRRSRPDAPGGEVAIIGMACRLPGGIDSPEALWSLLSEGGDAIGLTPEGRWRWPAEIDPAGSHRGIDRGGFLEDIASFDASFFRLSTTEVESMDPQQRILLELSWHTLENAGYPPSSLTRTRTGVFIGASGSDYSHLLHQSSSAVEAHFGTGSAVAVLANRISYFYDFYGPSLVVDTACSSSLVALHKAVQSLRAGECSQILVGGVHVMCHPANSLAYYKAGMLARDGRCKTFDHRADGYVRAEGAVMLLLKPLEQALADRDHIHAVIRGSACNHGGLASGLTVPNPERQAALLRQAWSDAGIDPEALTCIEAHGTGTALGDPIEIQGLKEAFAGHAAAVSRPLSEKRCGLGSIKTNLGHLEAAAGLAGVLKVLLELRHRQLPALVNFQQLNPRIDLEGSSLYLVDQHRPWTLPQGVPSRMAGVSSFGSGGTNAHVILEEFPQASSPTVHAPDQPLLFVLSARNQDRLHASASQLLEWLERRRDEEVPLLELIYTLQVGRQPLEARLALAILDVADLRAQLHSYLARGENVVPARLPELGRQWLSGAEVDWAALYDGANPPRRIELPGYPFARVPYWHSSLKQQPDESRGVLLAPMWSPLPSSPDATAPSSAGAARPSSPDAARRTASNAALPSSPDTTRLTPSEAALSSSPDAARRTASNAALPSSPDAARPTASDHPVIVGGTDRQQADILEVYPTARRVAAPAGLSLEAWEARWTELGEIDHIIWIAPATPVAAMTDARMIDDQEVGLLQVFRMVKALLALGYGGRKLKWTFITFQTQQVHRLEAIDPIHAGLPGFAGCLAREYSRWDIRTVDLQRDVAWPVRELFSQGDAHGPHLAHRASGGAGGRWFRQELLPVVDPEKRLAQESPTYREKGVYVVIGGAGGLGEVWTRYMIDQYQAQVIWIGRRQKDEALQSRLDALTPAPYYISADASDLEALRGAYAQIKQLHPVIHGVVHAAVGSFDESLAEMGEEKFRHILSAKIDISVRLAQVFSGEKLDFVLFFSSILSFLRSGGVSGYTAGCCFKDAFAGQLAREWPCLVKVMNWGYWSVGTGERISRAARIRLAQSGFGLISETEGMQALETLLISPMSQLLYIKARTPRPLPMISLEESITCLKAAETAPDPVQSLEPLIAAETTPDALRRIDQMRGSSIFRNEELEALLLRFLAAFVGSRPTIGHALYQRWFAQSAGLLREKGVDPERFSLDDCWKEWEVSRERWQQDPNRKAAVNLVDRCLNALPDVLAGRRKATDVMFPGSSMSLVEGIYRNNLVSDYFNHLLGSALVALIQAHGTTKPLRILEIGAGTGGTTAIVLEHLAPIRERIAEYCYTDVSKAFLFHAEEHFVPRNPFIRTALFDVTQPLETQAIQSGTYDLVIATNVLHATPNIGQTLRNTKATLCHGGVLILNELSCHSIFAHLTFGLLDGWWLHEDSAIRIPGSPGLSPQGWRHVLEQEGFDALCFPVLEAHALGQQIVVARSDGIVRQERAALPAPEARKARPRRREADGGSLREESTRYFTDLIGKVLRIDSQDIDPAEPLESYGIDSILIVQITDVLQEVFGEVSSTLFFEFQTIDALVAHFIQHQQEALCRLLGIDAQGPSATAQAGTVDASAHTTAPVRARITSAREPIAIIGMSGHYPMADSLEAFWENLREGRDCVTEIPGERWPLEGFFLEDREKAIQSGKSYSRWGGFLKNVFDFDARFFNISPREARNMDPQERIFLQAAWEALEDAGYTRKSLATLYRQRVGVFVGITRTGFDLFGPKLWERGDTAYPHTSFSSVANRLSYHLDLRGPSLPIDTMCSSSLTAIHEACERIQHGECELAFAGGVNVYVHASSYVGLCASRMLSPDGRCRSFGSGANGFVPGEGVGVVLMKPLSRAIEDHDHIHGIIRGTFINHGGKTNGYTVPNPVAQAELVREALDRAGVHARAVSYVEAHGTGTELGDPIEVTGLTQAFQRETSDTGFCALGSVKTNVGHLEAAAAMAGLTKVLLQMKHGQLVPSLHAQALNHKIDFQKTPFVVQRSLEPWKRPTLQLEGGEKECPRIAGLSSFGAGGANAHVVLEEYVPPGAQGRKASIRTPALVLLSARTDEQLRRYARRLLEWLRKGADCALEDLAYTLQVGREPMEERLALIVDALPDLEAGLEAFLAGKDAPPGRAYRGRARPAREALRGVISEPDGIDPIEAALEAYVPTTLADLWVRGGSVDWERLYLLERPFRVSLPTYPFADTPYWWQATPEADEARALTADSLMADGGSRQAARPVALSAAHAVTAAAAAAPSTPAAQAVAAAAATTPSTSAAAKAPPRPLVKLQLPPLQAEMRQSDQTEHAKPRFSLAALTWNGAGSESPDGSEEPARKPFSGASLQDAGQGVMAIRMAEAGGDSLTGLLEDLAECLRQLRAMQPSSADGETGPRVVLLIGDREFFLPGTLEARTAILQKGIIRQLLEIDDPLIGVMKGNGQGAGWLLGSLCDLLICAREGMYRYAAPDWPLSLEERAFFQDRFGEAGAEEFLRVKTPLFGESLYAKGFGMTVLAAHAVEEHALGLAARLARSPRRSLVGLKQLLAGESPRLAGQLATCFTPLLEEEGGSGRSRHGNGVYPDPKDTRPVSARKIELQSPVVSLEAYPNGVVVVTLRDPDSKNMFSPAYLSGVQEAFAHIRSNPDYKVVILTGYDSYFACGGTRESLEAIQRGTEKFTDTDVYGLPLLCEIPVIAAMQGHALGGGWSMGMFCDQVIFSRESLYQAPYMRFGFTPGAGSTLIFPARFGKDLGREILLTADEYRGRDLELRGIRFPVRPRGEVLSHALELASIMARSTREALVSAKSERSSFLRRHLQDTYRRELAMHEKTYVGNPDVFTRIQHHFNDGMQARETVNGTASAPATPHLPATGADPALKKLRSELRASLADTLNMPPAAIEDDLEFLEMGLDPIMAVAWVQKLNHHYGLSLQDGAALTHKHLTGFARFLLQELSQSQRAPAAAADATRRPAGPEVQPGFKPMSVAADIGATAHNRQRALNDRTSEAASDASFSSTLTEMRALLAEELHMTPSAVEDDVEFVQMGLDSIIAVTWIQKVNQAFGLALNATTVYNYPSLVELARHLASQRPHPPAPSRTPTTQSGESPVLPKEPPVKPATQRVALEPLPVLPKEPPVKPATQRVALEPLPALPKEPPVKPATQRVALEPLPPLAPAPATRPRDIAIVGMAGRFPKADSPEQFWENILEGRDCISEVPAHRWSVETYFDPDRNVPGKTMSRWMGIVDDADCFDPHFFAISPREAELMDPQQRLFLEACWTSIEDAGYNPRSLSGTACGVFVGCEMGDYGRAVQYQELDAQSLMGGSVSMLPARIAYALNLQGPSMAIDTACSSSLVAIANACDSLILGQSDSALAGGVCVLTGPEIHIMMSKAGMLSPDGRCHTFDQKANGFVPGEGVGVVFLKRLDDAVRDRDPVYAVIRGWGVNQDGKTNGITAPNGLSQTRLQRKVYEQSGIHPEEIQLIEAHGTGTRLGDPIEVQALSDAFGHFTRKQRYCALGSVKSNIGHLATAAGVSGLIKLALAVHHRKLPPTIHYETLNEHIRLEGTPFFINTEAREWPASEGRRRNGAISSFGFGGTNAHMVLEEHVRQSTPTDRPAGPVALVLSARNQERLEVYARELLAYLERSRKAGVSIRLVDLAYTLQIGREAMEERVGFLVESLEELETRLNAFLTDGQSRERITHGYRGRVTRDGAETLAALVDPEDIAAWIEKRKYERLLNAWARGAAIDWSRLYDAAPQPPVRLHIPTYPFARERYWVARSPAAHQPDTAALEPARSQRFFERIEALLETWEQQRQQGQSLSAETLTRTFAYEVVSSLEPELIQKVDRLLSDAPAEPPAPAKASTAPVTHPPVSEPKAGPAPVAHPPVGEPKAIDISQAIREALTEVLKLTQIGDHDRFQDYGLDSISAMQLSVRLEKKLGKPIRPQWIHDYPSVGTLARRLNEQAESSLA